MLLNILLGRTAALDLGLGLTMAALVGSLLGALGLGGLTMAAGVLNLVGGTGLLARATLGMTSTGRLGLRLGPVGGGGGAGLLARVLLCWLHLAGTPPWLWCPCGPCLRSVGPLLLRALLRRELTYVRLLCSELDGANRLNRSGRLSSTACFPYA